MKWWLTFNNFDVLTTGKTSATTNKQRFESKNVIIRATVGYLSVFVFDIDLFYFLFFKIFFGRPILCRSGQGSFSPSLTNFYCWKSRWKDSRSTFCLLSVGRHLGISIVLECWLAYTQLKINDGSTGLLGRFWQIGWWTSDRPCV